MANLKEVRNRISSIKSTRQITSAMKMVSASKLHKTQQAILHLRVYTQQFKQLLARVSNQIPSEKHHFLAAERDVKSVLVISISSNKGLCGTYNAMIIKRTLQHIDYLLKHDFDVKLLLIGKKNESYFRKKTFEIFSSNTEIIDKVNPGSMKSFSQQIVDEFSKKSFDQVDVIYNRFINAVSQQLVAEQILPVPVSSMQYDGHHITDRINPDRIENPIYSDSNLAAISENQIPYILEPNPEEVFNALVPDFFQLNLYRIFLDASASEHGARMTAMHKATDNADDLLKSLTITYNKVRQAMITREIMEIVGGAEE